MISCSSNKFEECGCRREIIKIKLKILRLLLSTFKMTGKKPVRSNMKQLNLLTKRNWLSSCFIWIFKIEPKFIRYLFLEFLNYLLFPSICVLFKIISTSLVFFLFLLCFFFVGVNKWWVDLKKAFLKGFFVFIEAEILDFKCFVDNSIRVNVGSHAIGFWNVYHASKC